MLEVKVNRITDLEERADSLLKFVKNSINLRKYCENPIIQCAHSIQRMFLKILSANDPEYDYILERCKFGFWFANIASKQYSLMQMYIRTKTENIHVISRYTEESNIRIRLFEAILKSTSPVLKSEL